MIRSVYRNSIRTVRVKFDLKSDLIKVRSYEY